MSRRKKWQKGDAKDLSPNRTGDLLQNSWLGRHKVQVRTTATGLVLYLFEQG
jgi:hypothetical protein